MKLSKLKVHADISNQYAKVTYDMTFYNGKDRILEGELAFPLGQGQTVSHLSMDLNGYLRDAVIVEKELGRVAYENTIKQRIDPA
ncbi:MULTISPECIES: VIT domain-containing protein [unclassified Winogradskyella]|uniref:VIT domain-containing protein n=1 Tax=unclassified Winogradskyella TaxID=2615021 RepID=UPI0012F7C36B|nr:MULTISPECIES: VIT domain-containing protein [unclassified Winogradskyella]